MRGLEFMYKDGNDSVTLIPSTYRVASIPFINFSDALKRY